MADGLELLKSTHRGLLAQGHRVEALLILERALNEFPGEFSLIDDYITASRNLIDTGSAESKTEHLESLEAFVKSKLLTVPIDAVPALMRRVAELRSVVAPSPREQQELPPFDTNLPEWKEACSGALDGKAPQGTEAARERLAALEAVRDSVAPSLAKENAQAVTRLDGAIEACRLAVSFDTALPEAARLTTAAAASPTAERGAYALQQAESILKPFAVEAERLNNGRQEQLDDCVRRLKEGSEKLSRIARNMEAAAAWGDFIRENRHAVDACRQWTKPGADKPDGTCEDNIKSARRVAQALQEVAHRVAGTSSAGAMSETASALNDSVARALAAQQTRYDQWAVSKIRSGYEACKAHIGIIDDEKKLDETMGGVFGEIDTRCLGHEAQRCYSEVFELLFGHLDAPDDPKEFDKQGTKLHVLLQMMSAKKKALLDF